MASLSEWVLVDLLEKTLMEYVDANPCNCLLLSGGIDTTTVAVAMKLTGLRPVAFTAYFLNGVARDLPYAIYAAHVLGLDHVLVGFTLDDVVKYAREITKCVERIDYIELRNDVAIYAALLEAKKLGCKCIYLGEGGDELFIGYQYMQQYTRNELEKLVLKYSKSGRYPSIELAECLGLEPHAPLLTDSVVEIAVKSIDYNRVPPGKILLRNLLRRHGLPLIAERVKTPIEEGVGTNILDQNVLEQLTGLKLEIKKNRGGLVA